MAKEEKEKKKKNEGAEFDEEDDEGKKKAPPKKPTSKKALPADVRHIVRIAGKDLNGGYAIPRALIGVKGVNTSLANAIARRAAAELGFDPTMMIGRLDEKQSEALEDIVLNPAKHSIPEWMLNRRKDPYSGKSSQLTGHEWDFTIKGDIDTQKKIRSYKGVRHSLGLTVRGQRTRTSGRKGITVGVKRNKNTHGSGK